MVKNGSEVLDPTVLLEGFQAGQASVAQEDQTSPQTAQLGLTSSFLPWSVKRDRLVLVSLLSLKLVCTLTPSRMRQAFQGKFKLLPGLEMLQYGLLNGSVPGR
jgi:hypothetical protein